MTDRKPLRSRAHVHINKFVSLSLPLDEIFDALASVGRRALVAVGNPRRGGKFKARVADGVVEQAAIDERERQLREAEKTLVGCGFKKHQARAAIDAIRPDMLGKESYDVVAAALRATNPPAAK